MALIVAPAAGAESYCSVATADLYHAQRGNAAWAAASVEVKEQKLRQATDYMTARYSDRWRGEPVTYGQPLDWPRVNASYNGWLLDSAMVPGGVAKACAELALRALAEPLYVDVEAQQVTSERVGPIAVTYAGQNQGQTRYAYVDDMLSRYLREGQGMSRAIRG